MNLKERLESYLNQHINLTREELDELFQIAEQKHFKKSEIIVRENDYSNKLFFAEEGCFRFYHLNELGIEITTDFYFAPTFITSYTSFIENKPSLVFVQALQDMDVLEIDKEDLNSLYSKNENIECFGRFISEMVAINSEKHLFLLTTQAVEKRYALWLENTPQQAREIPIDYIASYLGTTLEILNHIKNSSI